MTVFLLIIAALILPITMLVLSLSMNEFEKKTKDLGNVITKRYTYEPMKKSKATAMAKPPPQMLNITRPPGKP
jgi:hypothetical protein